MELQSQHHSADMAPPAAAAPSPRLSWPPAARRPPTASSSRPPHASPPSPAAAAPISATRRLPPQLPLGPLKLALDSVPLSRCRRRQRPRPAPTDPCGHGGGWEGCCWQCLTADPLPTWEGDDDSDVETDLTEFTDPLLFGPAGSGDSARSGNSAGSADSGASGSSSASRRFSWRPVMMEARVR